LHFDKLITYVLHVVGGNISHPWLSVLITLIR